ncbi:MAG: transporter substrate-binding domain-containing protein [Bacteroidota bacterium]|nr:transporter substrate-binding domain-containing protein [Bacteroidota bacterium]
MKTSYNIILIFLLGLLISIQPGKALSLPSDTLHYLGDENYPPFEFINDHGKPDGFNVTLLKKIAETLNYHYTIELIPWHQVVDSLQYGSKDYITSMFLSDKRKEKYAISTPYNKVSQVLFIRHDSDISGFEDIKDKTILVVKDDISFEFLMEFHITGNLKKFNNYTEAIKKLEEGTGDAVICPKIQGYYIIQKHNISGVTYLDIPFPLLDYCFATTKDNKHTLALLNEGLLMLEQNGEYDKIYEAWYSAYSEPDFVVFLRKWLLPAIFILAGLLVLVLIWVYSLRQRVLRKTLDLRLELHQRKLAEKKLKHAKEKAEESDKLKTAFLSNLNHEIRTPLNSIMGFSELMMENTDDSDPRKEHMEIIHKSSAQLLSIVEDMINMSKIEAGQIKIKNKKVRLHALLNDMKQLFDAKAENKNLDFTLELPEQDDFWIQTDAGKLKQILTNLLDNAFKNTEQGKIEFGYKRNNAYIEFFVNDTGYGIPEDKMNIIFDRFVQVNNKDTSANFGSGLGLSIARAYANMLKGNIHVRSALGKGSTFYFSIQPAEIMKIETTADVKHMDDLQKLRGKHILIAEDIIDNYIYIRESLKKHKVECVHAVNGEEAFTHVQQENFDAVLMDLKMPVLNGYESMNKIRELKPNLPIIALTAYAQNNERQQIIDAGFDDYLAKPVSRESIVNVLIENTSRK